jgi:hypothetical protein
VQRLLHELSEAVQGELVLREAEARSRAIASLVELAETSKDPAVRLEAIREILKHCSRQEEWKIE